MRSLLRTSSRESVSDLEIVVRKRQSVLQAGGIGENLLCDDQGAAFYQPVVYLHKQRNAIVFPQELEGKKAAYQRALIISRILSYIANQETKVRTIKSFPRFHNPRFDIDADVSDVRSRRVMLRDIGYEMTRRASNVDNLGSGTNEASGKHATLSTQVIIARYRAANVILESRRLRAE